MILFMRMLSQWRLKTTIKHFKRWNEWRKHNLNSPIYKLLVLFGICYSPTFDLYLTEECEEIHKAFMKEILKIEKEVSK